MLLPQPPKAGVKVRPMAETDRAGQAGMKVRPMAEADRAGQLRALFLAALLVL